MKQDTVYLKRYCNDGRIVRDKYFVKNFHELYGILTYVRDVVSSGVAHFDIEFVCNSNGFTLIGAL